MKQIKNKIAYSILMIIFTVAVVLVGNVSYAANTVDGNSIEEILKNQTSIDVNNLDMGQVLQAYEELSAKYSNEEIANIVEEHKAEIEKKGISGSTIDAGTKILRSVDAKELNKLLKEDDNINLIKSKLEQGDSPKEIIQSVQQEMALMEKLGLGFKLLMTITIVKVILITFLVLFVYGTILRWIIYRKAGRHGWAAIIPFYRDITMFKVSCLSPWWLLLLLIPILGWLILAIVYIFRRFCLAEAFNKGIAFGFGLLILPPIFESILAFSKNTEYTGVE